jgi:predicted enzyme related to lactoylglutathione lyase
MERINGIGGVFLRARDPGTLASWYAEHFGIEVEAWGGAVLHSAGGESFVWALFPAETDYLGSRDRQQMVNYRVRDLDAMLAQLRAGGVEVEGPRDSENGRFGWGTDPEGNRFELWQPPAGS